MCSKYVQKDPKFCPDSNYSFKIDSIIVYLHIKYNHKYLQKHCIFRFIVKHVHSSAIGRNENCNMLIAHIQYIGAESMASRYAYQISLFDTDSRKTGHKFEGLVTSTMKPLESQCSKEADIFVTTFHQAKTYTDQWANLNFIITMKKLEDQSTASNPSVVTTENTTPMETSTAAQTVS